MPRANVCNHAAHSHSHTHRTYAHSMHFSGTHTNPRMAGTACCAPCAYGVAHRIYTSFPQTVAKISTRFFVLFDVGHRSERYSRERLSDVDQRDHSTA